MASDRSEATKRALCLATEAMVAREGLSHVALRSVAAAAGQGNTAAVTYHFGNIDKLLRATVDMRVRDLEGERLRLIDEAGGDVAALDAFTAWRCMMRPVLSLPDEQAPHAHVRFLMHMRLAGRLSDPLDPSIERPDAPTMSLLLARIQAGLAHLPYQIARARIAFANMVFWNAVMLHDEKALGSAGDAVDLPTLLADAERLVRTILGEAAASFNPPHL